MIVPIIDSLWTKEYLNKRIFKVLVRDAINDLHGVFITLFY